MEIIQNTVCGRNVWTLSSTLNYISILQPVNFNVFLHGNFLQCRFKISFRFVRFIQTMCLLKNCNFLLVFANSQSKRFEVIV